MQCKKQKCNSDKSVDVVEEQTESFLDWLICIPETLQEIKGVFIWKEVFEILRGSVVKAAFSHENALHQPSKNEGRGHMQKKYDIQW